MDNADCSSIGSIMERSYRAAGGELLTKYSKKFDKNVIIIGNEGVAESHLRTVLFNLGYKIFDSEI